MTPDKDKNKRKVEEKDKNLRFFLVLSLKNTNFANR